MSLKRTLLIQSIIIFSFLFQQELFSQAGDLDTAFGQGGIVTTAFNRTGSSRSSSILMQSDTKIIVAGIINSEDQSSFAAARYKNNGTLDSTFGVDGIADGKFSGGVYSAALQNDNKIILAGYFYNENASDFAVARFNQDGTIDNNFGTHGFTTTKLGSNSQARSVAIQNDGKIIAAGSYWDSTDGKFEIVRYNTDGTLDKTFGLDGIVTTLIGNSSYAIAVAVQDDGKILIAGEYSLRDIEYHFATVRYNSDGSLDTTFSSDGIDTISIGNIYDLANSIAVQSDNKIVIGGYAYLNSHYNFVALRYNVDGSIDKNFGTNGITITRIDSVSNSNSLGIQKDGKIIQSGYCYISDKYDFAAVRYNTNGSLDSTFGNNGIITTQISSSDDYSFSLAIQEDGKLLLTGNNFIIVRYNSDGSLDHTFGTNGISNVPIGSPKDIIYSVMIQNDGKIVAAGNSWINKFSNFAIARYNKNGTLDAGFGNKGIVTTPLGNSDSYVNSAEIQNDGKIVVAGGVVNGNAYDIALVRYNTNGSLDKTFGKGGIVETPNLLSNTIYPRSVEIQNDGKIIVATVAYIPGKGYNFEIIRYNQNGTIDVSFGKNGIVISPIWDASDYATSVVIQNYDKIVAAGFTNFSNFDFVLNRYNLDGSIDSSFGYDGTALWDVGNIGSKPNSITVQKDGKLVAAGYIYNNDWTDKDFIIVRYNMDGSPDSSFGMNGSVITNISNSNDYFTSVKIQSDNKIVVSGISTVKPGFITVRYNEGGSPDSSFGVNGFVITPVGTSDDCAYSLAIQNDGNIIVAGSSQDGNSKRFTLIRYLGDSPTGINQSNGESFPTSFELQQNYPNPFNPTTTIKYSIPNSEYVTLKIYDILGREIGNLVNQREPAGNYYVNFNASNLSSGVYLYQIKAGSFIQTKKMILLH